MSKDKDVSVCYQSDVQGMGGLCWRLNVAYHSELVGEKEAAPVQATYSVHGKTVNMALGAMSTNHGTVIVATPAAGTPQGALVGARMGLYLDHVFSPTLYECTSDETTPAPSKWHCKRKELGVSGLPEDVILTRVDSANSCCSDFSIVWPTPT